MCHFILMTLTRPDSLESVRLALEPFRRPLAPADIALVGTAPPGRVPYYTTSHCDCGTAVGSHDSSLPAPIERGVEKLRRKGWSPTKIARWREEREKLALRASRVDAQHAELSQPDCSRWVAILNAALNATSGKVGLLLTWSPRRSLEVREYHKLPLSEATPSLLYGLPEDVLCEFS